MNLQSKIVKIFLAALLVLSGIMAYAAASGRLISAPQAIAGAVLTPFQKAAASVSGFFDGLADVTVNNGKIASENEELRKELEELRKKQVDYDRFALENREYEKLFSDPGKTRNMELVSATVIGRDGLDRFYSFTIDRGENRGIEENDVVISSGGLVGVITETGPNFARVSTLLSPNVNVGCFVGASMEVGIARGSHDLAEVGSCTVSYLPKETRAAKGDIVSSSGYGGIFPAGLIIGTVDRVELDDAGNSSFAVVTPASDIKNVRFVFVITDFS